MRGRLVTQPLDAGWTSQRIRRTMKTGRRGWEQKWIGAVRTLSVGWKSMTEAGTTQAVLTPPQGAPACALAAAATLPQVGRVMAALVTVLGWPPVVWHAVAVTAGLGSTLPGVPTAPHCVVVAAPSVCRVPSRPALLLHLRRFHRQTWAETLAGAEPCCSSEPTLRAAWPTPWVWRWAWCGGKDLVLTTRAGHRDHQMGRPCQATESRWMWCLLAHCHSRRVPRPLSCDQGVAADYH